MPLERSILRFERFYFWLYNPTPPPAFVSLQATEYAVCICENEHVSDIFYKEPTMTNKQVYQYMRYYKSMRAAAVCTGNRSELERCNEILELLSECLVGGAAR